MPIYEYDCLECGERFQVLFKSMSVARRLNIMKKVECPKCGSNNLKKLMSAPGGFKFKGPGFYETEYKNKEKKKEDQ